MERGASVYGKVLKGNHDAVSRGILGSSKITSHDSDGVWDAF